MIFPTVNRRTLLAGAGVIAATAPFSHLAAQAPVLAPATVRTRAGLLQGGVEPGVHVFRGIPYGEPTGGTARFKAPVAKQPWDGVRPATAFGQRSPQNGGLGGPESPAFGEDCLALNVWTGSLEGHKPVMVWFHGGGWEVGGSNDPVSNGAYLAAVQDVVLVSVNHRLNVFGYLNLSGIGGEEYAASGHAGLLDMALALQWVRDNIEAFGGDPERVMIFGQSGGGRKVSTLMATPAAAGLFHRAGVISGSAHRMDDFAIGNDRAERVLHALDIPRNQFRRLLDVPTAALTQAGIVARNATGQFRPWVDGAILPRDPFAPDAPLLTAHVPMIIGTARDEIAAFLGPWPQYAQMSDAQVLSESLPFFPAGEAEPAIAAWRARLPEMTNTELFSRLITDRSYLLDANIQAERKSALRQAPAYFYNIDWQTDVGPLRGVTPHGWDLQFIFGNLDGREWAAEDRPALERLRSVMSGAFAALARDGVPEHPLMPQWLPYEPSLRATMRLGRTVRLESDPFRLEREYLSRIGSEQSGPREPVPPGPWIR